MSQDFISLTKLAKIAQVSEKALRENVHLLSKAVMGKDIEIKPGTPKGYKRSENKSIWE